MNYTRQAGISMLRWIPTLSDIFLPRKCLVGYVPKLLSTANYCGFEAIASGGVTVPGLLGPDPRPEQSQLTVVRFNQPGFKAFKGDGSEFQWQRNRYRAPYWVSITCPTHVRIWKVGLRGRNRTTDRLYDWRIEGSNKGDLFQKIPETDQSYPVDGNWDVIYTSPDNPIANRVCIDNEYKEFLIDSVVKYRFFKLFCNSAESERPGITTFQLFVYDD